MKRNVFGLIGRKLSHSDSAIIHEKFGLSGYTLFEIEPEEIESFLKRDDLRAINVTIPYKQAVIPYLTSLSREAREIESVNTIVFTSDGQRIGHNTDLWGFIYMAKRAGIDLLGKKALVFGSGGASKAAVAALKKMGARETVVISRSGENNYENLYLHEDAQILINATPVGMYPNVNGSAVDLSRFPKAAGALDMVYNPSETDFLRQARTLGIPYSNGLSMLVAQAKAAEEHFLSAKIDDIEIERVLDEVNRIKTNIALIGMPGSGKSAVGKALKALTGRQIIDIDAEIVAEAGKSIPEIMAQEGVQAFRDLESKVLARACLVRGCILITGGGAVLREENRMNLKRNSRTYRILRDVSLLPRDGRPLSKDADLNKMLLEREPYYNMAQDFAIDNNGTIEEAAEKIWRDFCEYSYH
ncbi:MAG: shikimate kinase [Clostridia bacterium]|nr:shikimate kinase [Clostridia bacterium]MBQ4158542.1 shikimate kinase [Clostridia bacterium]